MTPQFVFGKAFARYLNAVWTTSTIVYYPDRPALRATTRSILASWHGQHFMAPFARERDHDFLVPVAYGSFGSVYAHTFAELGLKVVRGSSGKAFHQAGGFKAFREMIRALETGTSVALTVDSQPAAKVVGNGVLALARHSGRPIVPLAAVTSRKIVLTWRWDRPAINLPFGRLAIAIGSPIFVASERSSQYLVDKRQELQQALSFVNLRAAELAGS